ncbi:Pex29p KNAG_0C06180 [Huiozyma naganishii CBS 8797]|uniref:TECPR1-like DysF domain-containing protein n=1 Tax=Huiozyma naganishii (strain ATCC MYA-139 / BCRC 22969 / CBS 8797 / KCTC 17520 / NBRC 10181 / NCYC 3082 / Yp74L-3) TaxID=1071383 RepID=J7S577_HUIN7|nr:hypothetical protein KNAG_0C06180 [Kazachstania naganishii CBS 8797]CCK69714.1 hypothetical protein KNAG_0C06180 [Kazachstania naganishii CBS 8797]
MESMTSFFWKDGEQPPHPAVKLPKRTKIVPKHEEEQDVQNKGSKAQVAGGPKAALPNSGATFSTGSLPHKTHDTAGRSTTLQQMMTDTLVEKIIKMALPPSSKTAKATIATRMAYGKNRPGLSVPITSRNFIQMNSRLGIPFIVLDEIITFINWENISLTLCIMLIYTYLVLKPVTVLGCGPPFCLLFGIMVPQYLHVHKPNHIRDNLVDVNRTPSQGPPIRKPILPDPVPELSQEFILNLTDLQNHMMLYVNAYDFTVFILKKFAFFINEQVSSLSFIVILIVALFNFIFLERIWPYLPVKMCLIALGWGGIIASHPSNKDRILKWLNAEETRLDYLSICRRYEHTLYEHMRFVEAREQKVVTIFEIQRYSETDKHKEWRKVGFSTDDYALFSKLRINELNISDFCCKELSFVHPPEDWEWVPGSGWTLDLDPKEWVEESFIQYVEVDSESKWVYDIELDGTHGQFRRRMWTNICRRKIVLKKVYGPGASNSHSVGSGAHGPDGQRSTSETVNGSASVGKHTRRSSLHQMDTTSDDIEEVVNPLRKDTYSEGKLHGITLGSMSGGITQDSTNLRSAVSDGSDHELNHDETISEMDYSDILNTSV